MEARNSPVNAMLLQVYAVTAMAYARLNEPHASRHALSKAIEPLFEKHDPAVVAVYLNAFQALDDNGWPSLAELLAEDPRLQLAAPADHH